MAQVDVRRVRDLVASLETLRIGGPPVLEGLVAELPDLLHAERSFAFSIEETDGRWEMGFVYIHAWPASRAKIRQLMNAALAIPGYITFDPRRTEALQRNVPLSLFDLDRIKRSISRTYKEEICPQVGLVAYDQLRMLVCDRSSLLSVVAAYRPEPFGAREKTALRRLLPALRTRLTLERQTATASLHETAFVAALEAISSAALLVDLRGRISHLNAAARALFEHDPASLRRAISDVLRAPQLAAESGFDALRLSAPGCPEHRLLVQRAPAADLAARAAAVSNRWGLTPGQTRVLELVAQGLANKTIAAELGRSENTVELHVTAILRKAQVHSRSELIARLLSMS